MLYLFVMTLLLSSCLMFLLEPMVGKMIIPFFGGTPVLWITCVMFFQFILLGGYYYSHCLPKLLKPKIHAVVHMGFVIIPLFFLPINISFDHALAEKLPPLLYALILLICYISVPFFVVSTTGPLLQKWYSELGEKNSGRPYFLYAASNVGSILPLIAYPTLIEPLLPVNIQSYGWSYGFYAFAALVIVCAMTFLVKSKGKEPDTMTTHNNNQEIIKPALREKLNWILLSFIPSSLMLGVTLYITDEMAIAPGPYFWVIPLALYLISFIIVFASKQVFTAKQAAVLIPITVIMLLLSIMFKQVFISVAVHLILFFLICIVCHGILSDRKPHPIYLTDFYMYLSLGGAIGGLFNAVIAPLVFPSIIEYPLVILCSMIIIALNFEKSFLRNIKIKDAAIPIAFLVLLMLSTRLNANNYLKAAITVGAAIILGLTIMKKTFRIAILFSLFFIFSLSATYNSNLVYIKRDFFGVNKVISRPDLGLMTFLHGNTFHGVQSLKEEEKLVPTGGCHRTGPLGDFFRINEGQSANWKIGAAGMGIGTMLCYNKPGQDWVYYEISPTVINIASNPQYFSLVSKYKPRIVEGDARISIKKEPDNYFDFLILDAYSSDNIPTHLLTSQAFDLYLSKLKKGGYIASNITNRALDLKPVFASIAENKGLKCVYKEDKDINSKDSSEGKFPSTWIIMSSDNEIFKKFSQAEGWKQIKNDSGFKLWTDDYTSIFKIMKIR